MPQSDRLIRRDRLLVGIGLAATSILAWAYLLRTSAAMHAMITEARMHAAMGMADTRVWGLSDWFGLFAMWTVMMAAMMLPSAAPVVIVVLGVYQGRSDRQARLSSAAFVCGYLATWTMFGVAASTAQFALHRTALLGADMRVGSAAISGVVLLLAGFYQWLPIKNRCLTHCHSPISALSRDWREGPGGGFIMGVRHGLLCVGCCWLLMTLLFVVGVMNLLWVATLAVFVLIEKLAPGGARFGRVAGVAAAAWGIYLLVTGVRS